MGDKMKLMKKIYLIILAVLILGGVYYMTKKTINPTVTINNQVFNVEIARTSAERAKGLMGRDHLDENTGMLFVFNDNNIHPFWMKNTLIPLDIIWIDDNKIAEIKTLQPQNGADIPQYAPKNKANYVLELNAGLSAENGLKVGDPVKINF